MGRVVFDLLRGNALDMARLKIRKLRYFVLFNKFIGRLLVFCDLLVIIWRYSTAQKLLNLLIVLCHLIKKDAELRSYPYKAMIETTNYCNLSCPYCPNGMNTLHREKRHMDREDFCKVIDQLAPYLYIAFPGLHGEPFLAPGLIDMIEYLHKKRISCQVFTNLNVKLKEEEVQRLIDSEVMILRISIDGASQETYQKYRVGGDFGIVMENVRLINVVKKRNKSIYPILIWQFLVFNFNENDILPAYHMAKGLNMRFFLRSPNCYDEVRSRLTPDGCLPVQQISCQYPCSSVFVHSNLDVSICYVAISSGYKMGKFPKDNFLEFWNNERFRRARDIVAGRALGQDSFLAKLCARCKLNDSLDMRKNDRGGV